MFVEIECSENRVCQSLPQVCFLSLVASVSANLWLDRQREPVLPDVVRAKRVELIDASGRIRGAFQLTPTQEGDVVPGLVMSDADGREAIMMGVSRQGFGTLAFSSDHWNEGAVALGYLGKGDDVWEGEEKEREKAKERGIWGLEVKSPKGQYTMVGYKSDGMLLEPNRSEAQPKPK